MCFVLGGQGGRCDSKVETLQKHLRPLNSSSKCFAWGHAHYSQIETMIHFLLKEKNNKYDASAEKKEQIFKVIKKN